MGQMSRESQEALKRRLRQELSSKQQGAISKRANMATLSQEEFHPEKMNPGSTGEYKDMKGGAHFTDYDCGHPYDDSVVRESFSQKKEITRAEEMLSFLQNKTQVQKALIAGEILGKRGGISHRKRR